ncbi:hypothetical protein HK104_007112, partial [Borealophlyctis nickersoniae]
MSDGGTEMGEQESWLAKHKDPAGQVTKPGEQTEQESLRGADDNEAYCPSDAEEDVDENAFRSPGFMKLYFEDRQHQEERMFQLMEMLNNHSSSSSSDAARLNKEKRDRQGRNLPKFDGDKDANVMAFTGFLRAPHDFLDLYNDPAEREGRAYVQHRARHLGPGTASQWWIEAEHSILTREAFVAFWTRFTPVNTQNTVKERLRALRFVLSLRDYTTDFSRLLSEAQAAESAEFSQNDLKTWFLSGLRRSANEHGKWIADHTIGGAMGMCGNKLPTGTAYTWSDVTLSEVQEAALSVYQSRGWSDEHPLKQRRKADAAPAFGKMSDKRERPKPYDRTSNSDIACYYCREKGHIKPDCAKWKKDKK